MNCPTVPLGDICDVERHGLRPGDPVASRLLFVGFENVESASGAINFDSGSRVGSQSSTIVRFDESHVSLCEAQAMPEQSRYS